MCWITPVVCNWSWVEKVMPTHSPNWALYLWARTEICTCVQPIALSCALCWASLFACSFFTLHPVMSIFFPKLSTSAWSFWCCAHLVEPPIQLPSSAFSACTSVCYLAHVSSATGWSWEGASVSCEKSLEIFHKGERCLHSGVLFLNGIILGCDSIHLHLFCHQWSFELTFISVNAKMSDENKDMCTLPSSCKDASCAVSESLMVTSLILAQNSISWWASGYWDQYLCHWHHVPQGWRQTQRKEWLCVCSIRMGSEHCLHYNL